MKDIIYAWGIAFILGAVLTPALIPMLRKLKFGQLIREDGPQGHLKKAGTPTMGGIAFLAAIVITGLLFVKKYPNTLPVLLITLGFGLVGFADDFLKIKHKHNEGLTVKQKFLLQLVMTGIYCWYRMKNVADAAVIKLPFTDVTWDMKWLYIPFFIFVVLGTDNGVNLNDGLDGLCSSVTMIIALFLTALSALYGGGLEPLTAAVAGALLGFLLFNTNPAKVFMGDTGALALGAFVSASFLELRQPLMILVAGFVYFIEVFSVMLQVGYFKYTKKKYGQGRRIFRMSPIHHHFELGGWSEPRVVIVFTAVTIFLCAAAYLGA